MAAPSIIEMTETIEFRASVTAQLQLMPGKLWPLAMHSSVVGPKVQLEDQFGIIRGSRVTDREGDTVYTKGDISRRWLVKPDPIQVAQLIDRNDQLSTKVDLQSPLVFQVAQTIKRAWDEAWLLAWYGNAITGKEGTVAVPFSPANIIPVDFGTPGTPSGLTIPKLVRAMELLQESHVDTEMETPFVVHTAKQQSDLLKLAQIQSTDFNPIGRQPLQEGRVKGFMGFEFSQVQIGDFNAFPEAAPLTSPSAGVRALPCGVKSGMHGAMWEQMFTRITTRSDKRHAWDIYADTTIAATRMMEGKCVQILCLET